MVIGAVRMWSAGMPDHESKRKVYCGVGSYAFAVIFVPLMLSVLPLISTIEP